MDTTSDDPFGCFGSDEDDGSDVEGEKGDSTEIRDPSCGVLSFHAGTEMAMLNHVIRVMETGGHERDESAVGRVLAICDDFCMKRHWMMHIGREKSEILKQFVEERCLSCPSKSHELLIVELGTYCGYSSLSLAKNVIEAGYTCHIFTVEVVLEHVRVAKRLIEVARMEDKISIIHLGDDSSLSVSLREAFVARNGKESAIDFLFIDHDKSMYLSDLKELERAGMIEKGCHVAADNVVFAKIDDYREYVSGLQAQNVLRTKLKLAGLEYSDPDRQKGQDSKAFQDGIGDTGSTRVSY